MLVRNGSSPSILDCIFVQHILEIKPNQVHQAFDGGLIEITTMGELLLGWPKGGRGSLIEVGHFRQEKSLRHVAMVTKFSR